MAQLAIEAFEQVIADALAEGYEVNLAGFGKFSSVHRDESERPNPAKKGEKVTVPAHNAPKFKPSTALKKALNGGEEAGEDE